MVNLILNNLDRIQIDSELEKLVEKVLNDSDVIQIDSDFIL